MNKDTLTWAAKAFILTVLVLLLATLVAQPLLGRARSDGAGIEPALGADDVRSRSNWQAMVPGQAAPPGSGPGEAVLAAADDVSPLIIPAADFTSDGNDPDGFYFDFAGGYINGDGTACLKAAAYLPQGVVVREVYASIYDNAAGNVMVNLWRVDRNTGATDVMATVSTVLDSTSIQHVE